MDAYFRASSWDSMLQFVTAGVWLFSLAFIIYNPHIATILFFGVLVVAPMFFMIRGYKLKDQKLIIYRLGWTTEIDLKDFKKVEIVPQAMKKSIRMLGNGGLYAWIGTFRNSKLGTYRVYATNRNRCVVFESEDRKLVVTPSEMDEFVKETQKHLKA